jgi:prefoldin subunit 5
MQNMQSFIVSPGQELGHLGQSLHNEPTLHNSVPLNSLQFASRSYQGSQVNTQYTRNLQTIDNNIPQWALHLCEQMNSIQFSIENQDRKWQVLENKIEGQNAKIFKLENQFSNISTSSRSSYQAETEIELLKTEMKQLKHKVTEYDETIKTYSDICDEITANHTAMDTNVNNLNKKIEKLENNHREIATSNEQLKEKVTDLQWRSMRENLIFSGIEEAENNEEEPEDCEVIIKNFIRDTMKVVGDIPFDRVHRLGRYNIKAQYPRPIVAKFTFYKDKEFIRLRAPSVLKNTNYYVKEQYPHEIEEKRKPLYKIAKDARENPENSVKLVRDKLFINNKLYVPSGDESSRENDTAVKTVHLNDMTQQQSAEYSNRKHLQTKDSNKSQWTRIFKRSTTFKHSVQQRPASRIYTRNSFSA